MFELLCYVMDVRTTRPHCVAQCKVPVARDYYIAANSDWVRGPKQGRNAY